MFMGTVSRLVALLIYEKLMTYLLKDIMDDDDEEEEGDVSGVADASMIPGTGVDGEKVMQAHVPTVPVTSPDGELTVQVQVDPSSLRTGLPESTSSDTPTPA